MVFEQNRTLPKKTDKTSMICEKVITKISLLHLHMWFDQLIIELLDLLLINND